MSLSLFEAIAEARDPTLMIHHERLSPAARIAAHTVCSSEWQALMTFIDGMTQETHGWLAQLLQEILGAQYHVTAEWVPHHRT